MPFEATIITEIALLRVVYANLNKKLVGICDASSSTVWENHMDYRDGKFVGEL